MISLTLFLHDNYDDRFASVVDDVMLGLYIVIRVNSKYWVT